MLTTSLSGYIALTDLLFIPHFVLATNNLDTEELSNDEMIAKYKEQQAAERGFAFLKDPLFFTDSVFLKTHIPHDKV